MKLQLETYIDLSKDQLFQILAEYVDTKLGKKLTNVYFTEYDSGMTAKLVLAIETLEVE
jgi:hypothetical protein